MMFDRVLPFMAVFLAQSPGLKRDCLKERQQFWDKVRADTLSQTVPSDAIPDRVSTRQTAH